MSTSPVRFVDSVSQTLFIPLWAKANENRRPDAILQDKEAERIVSQLPDSLFAFPKRKMMMVGSVVRARCFDDHARDALARDSEPVLVHLGCGLDDRFGRTDRGKGVQINIDLPDVMALRGELMPNINERNHDWVGSLLETDWMNRLLTTWPQSSFTFFMEGLLMYFDEHDIRELFTRLAERFPGARLHFDVCSSFMRRLVGSRKAIRQANAQFKWGLDDNHVPEQWHPQLRFVSSVAYFDIFHKRWGLTSLVRFVPYLGSGSRMIAYRIL